MSSDENAKSITNVLFADEARKELFEGLQIVADAVGCTLGPKGKTVIIQKDGFAPVVTKDGVSVSRSIRLKHPVKRMGAELIREAASRTNDVAGDGTTTATVLTHAMVKEGLKLLASGYSAQELSKGIELSKNLVIEQLKSSSKKISTSEELQQIATISANGDAKIGALIADAMKKVGSDGIITVEDAKGTTTSLDIVEGMQFDRGYLSPYFVNNNERMIASYSDAAILVTDKKISHLKDLVPILEQVMQSKRSLLIIADGVDGDALQGLVLNRLKTQLQVVAVNTPGYGQHRADLLRDICALTGATLVSSMTGVSLEQVKLAQLGSCKKFITDAKSTTIVSNGTQKAAVETLVNDLKVQLNDVTLTVDDIVKLKVRLAKMSSGVAIIKVGGLTEIEMIERKYRIEDALNATRAAADQGIVPGGGMALIDAAKMLAKYKKFDKNVMMGASIVTKACYAPIKRICENAGISSDVVINRIDSYNVDSTEANFGYDASTDMYVNMITNGIIDPVKVTIAALENAASVATTFLSLDAVVFNEEENENTK